MASKKRKLWATGYYRMNMDKHRHESKAAAYRWVEHEVVERLAGNRRRSAHVMVWVDERDGQGWQRYEVLDLDELASAGSQVGDR